MIGIYGYGYRPIYPLIYGKFVDMDMVMDIHGKPDNLWNSI